MAILIIDDHPVVLNGTKAILTPHFDVLTLEGSQQVVSNVEYILAENEIELCLIDVQMPEISGIELCRMIRASSKSIKLILYTGYDVNDYAELLVKLEVDGIISKTASKEQLIHCIEGTLLGQMVMPVELFSHLMRCRTDKNEEVELLNERELAILQHVAEGHTNKAIALLLEVSQRTIENHLTKIFDKLQVGSRAEAVLKARDLKVI